LRGTILRSNVDDAYDEFVDDQVKGIEADIAAERARIKSANEKEKSKIQQTIAHLKEKRHQRIAELKEKHKSRKEARLKNKIDEQKAETSELESKLNKME
jgi:predicted  nucleic acid-binding Zn-ribbon protein